MSVIVLSVIIFITFLVIVTRAKRTDRLLETYTRATIDASIDTKIQLRQIHTLVNSNMTEAMRNTLEEAKGSLVLMQEVNRLNIAAGNELGSEATAAIEAKRERVAELEANLADRLRQTKVADEKAEQQQQQQQQQH